MNKKKSFAFVIFIWQVYSSAMERTALDLKDKKTVLEYKKKFFNRPFFKIDTDFLRMVCKKKELNADILLKKEYSHSILGTVFHEGFHAILYEFFCEQAGINNNCLLQKADTRSNFLLHVGTKLNQHIEASPSPLSEYMTVGNAYLSNKVFGVMDPEKKRLIHLAGPLASCMLDVLLHPNDVSKDLIKWKDMVDLVMQLNEGTAKELKTKEDYNAQSYLKFLDRHNIEDNVDYWKSFPDGSNKSVSVLEEQIEKDMEEIMKNIMKYFNHEKFLFNFHFLSLALLTLEKITTDKGQNKFISINKEELSLYKSQFFYNNLAKILYNQPLGIMDLYNDELIEYDFLNVYQLGYEGKWSDSIQYVKKDLEGSCQNKDYNEIMKECIEDHYSIFNDSSNLCKMTKDYAISDFSKSLMKDKNFISASLLFIANNISREEDSKKLGKAFVRKIFNIIGNKAKNCKNDEARFVAQTVYTSLMVQEFQTVRYARFFQHIFAFFMNKIIVAETLLRVSKIENCEKKYAELLENLSK